MQWMFLQIHADTTGGIGTYSKSKVNDIDWQMLRLLSSQAQGRKYF